MEPFILIWNSSEFWCFLTGTQLGLFISNFQNRPLLSELNLAGMAACGYVAASQLGLVA